MIGATQMRGENVETFSYHGNRGITTVAGYSLMELSEHADKLGSSGLTSMAILHTLDICTHKDRQSHL